MLTEKKIPLHRKLYEILRRGIEDGIYQEGNLIPSENELCAVHNVTRPTVRQALTALVNDGYIKKHHGKGSIVQPVKRGMGILSVHGSTDAIGNKNLETKIIVNPIVKAWDNPFYFDLTDIEYNSGCIYFERVRLTNNSPIIFEKTYLPNIQLSRFTNRKLENKSLFKLLRESYQIEVKGGTQRIKAIAADKTASNHLKVPEGQSIVYMERKFHTNNPQFFFYSILYCSTEDLYLEGEF